MTPISPAAVPRRTIVKGSVLAAALAAVPASAHAGTAQAVPRQNPAGIALVRNRLTLPSGIATGDVTSDSAVLWSRASGPGRMTAVLRAVDDGGEVLRGRGAFERVMRGPRATQACDFTAKIHAGNLPSNTRFALDISFEDDGGAAGESVRGTFRTAPDAGTYNGRGRTGGTGNGGGVPSSSAQSFVWTGDTAGQGWGINEEIGGMRGYRAMHQTRPDFFIHSGDTVYADGPLAETVVEKDGQVWRNLVTEEVSKVAETLTEFRGRHRYNSMDANMRAMFADVPVIANWDDHETTNNWYPGEILDDPRYTIRDVNTLAARGRQAWQENMPIADSAALWRPGTFDDAGQYQPARIYRKISRGPQLDIFCLDMRTFKSPNTDGKEAYATSILGQEQVDWLIREVSKSKATWKVIAADLPLGIIVPDGAVNQESLANRDPGAPLGRELEIAGVLSAFKRNRVKNVVWLTADVHYCAAHHYSPERAAFTDFDPFWEFVAGPIAAGSFGPNAMDGTFGPEVVFSKAGKFAGESPRDGENQFFGHVELDSDTFTVSLRNANGATVLSKVLTPQR
ncbi:alkaline phosphatase [Pseudarthrobacter sp. NCCP-2145]|uniref:alkaline phosphatase D family protein n=1 Tax=Pseudarthrobacter sp. NCCP-2145 TaxID=2942290 RepID=UPI00203AC8C7|nr:alkaline phosphatase D family protein [Pseudarthrobacter sp. NCCP-2145]GKV72712.1 extracelullar DNA degradation protein EddA [Pseudarthrobacter sp. NCCP-2145]